MADEKKEEHKPHEHAHHHEHHPKKPISQKLKRLNYDNIFVAVALILGVVVLVNLVITFNINKDINKGAADAEEAAKPAKIELTTIVNPTCTDCFDITAVSSHVKTGNVEITSENSLEFDSNEAKAIISKYNIQQIPAIVITGEIDKINIQGLVKNDDSLLLPEITPPYTDAETGEIQGRVTLYNLNDPACIDCNDLATLVNQIKSSGITITEEKNIDSNSAEGKELIDKYKIDFIPIILFSEDAGIYPIIQQAWPQIGSIESDGTHVMRVVNPPYINITTGKLRGLIDITYLTDSTCIECYDVNTHKEIITSPQSFAMILGKEETVDISDVKGKELIAKYDITQVPTVILSEEIDAYPSRLALSEFFSVEEDNSYVFRRPSVMGNYKDLTTDEVVIAQQQG
ncbi:hypothetical protein CMO83_01065 [Candidatus Woesearchaeota archaeon]|jgi:hypothetical protein|nr:hypothetical protein [Candidatus Woesearchaeota archaeon]MDP6648456.1 hypothetical protein [Candidatus Woesearchaeota archaeon]|tara:strand:+ start:37407 stop:38612 length:1206 start_codon:yes stop_codon:yes gene_type:complete